MNLLPCAFLLALSQPLLACGPNALDLDGPALQASDEPDVLGVARERVETMVVDGQRLYWIGTHQPRTDGRDVWFLRSCQKHNCAATVVTYDAQRFNVPLNREAGAADPRFGTSSIQHGEIYWYQPETLQFVACPVAGCNGTPRVVATDIRLSAAVLDDERLFFAEDSSLFSVPLTQPGPRRNIAPDVNLGITPLALHGDYLYWLDGNEKGLRRTRKDGSSGIETITEDARYSPSHGFGVATDSSAIYWTNNSLSGSINRCPLAGCSGSPEVVFAPLRAPHNLLLDGSELYYQYEAAPYEYTLAHCSLPDCVSSQALAEHLDAPQALALDEEYLYLATTEQDINPQRPTDTVARIRQVPKPERGLP